MSQSELAIVAAVLLSSSASLLAIGVYMLNAKKSNASTAPTTPDSSGSTTGGSSGGLAVPAAVLAALGIDAEQLKNILAIINGAEQSSVNVVQAADGGSIYGYCENIGDGRGATVGIAGFTTDDNSALDIFKAFGASSYAVAGDPKQCKGKTTCAFCKWVKEHASDPKWIAANWQAYLSGSNSGYLGLVKKYKPANIKSALAVGVMLDCAMNAGEEKEGNAWGIKEQAAAASKASEEAFVSTFISNRIAHFTKSSGSGVGRMSPWKKMLTEKKMDMRIDPCKYAWCNESTLGKCCRGCPTWTRACQ